ncbi:MAG: DUF4244 domain-containing protein [Bifidobacteriaceae bacterium]|jgi:hypothetical protein|nr:DUF4244 domain-containing protein [Bifidobacteriaceae bacterium]
MALHRISRFYRTALDACARPFERRSPWQEDVGAATAEYAIAIVAAAGFAGLLVTLLTSDTARTWLTNIIEGALSL